MKSRKCSKIKNRKSFKKNNCRSFRKKKGKRTMRGGERVAPTSFGVFENKKCGVRRWIGGSYAVEWETPSPEQKDNWKKLLYAEYQKMVVNDYKIYNTLLNNLLKSRHPNKEFKLSEKEKIFIEPILRQEKEDPILNQSLTIAGWKQIVFEHLKYILKYSFHKQPFTGSEAKTYVDWVKWIETLLVCNSE